MRKYLSSAFSDRSLREQENLVAEIVDEFITKIDPAQGGEEVDLVNMFNLTTFDIIGSLAFGESFGGVAAGQWLFSSRSRMGAVNATGFRQRTSLGLCRNQQSR